MDEALAAAYPLGPVRASSRLDRISSRLVRLEIANRAYWLKLVHRPLDALESDAEVASELADSGLPVTRAVRRRDGRYAGMLALPEGPVPAQLFEEAPGDQVDAPSIAQAEVLGALLARLHANAARAADRRWRIDADALAGAPIRALEAWGGTAARSCAALAKLAGEMVAIVWKASLPIGLCHGDIQLENVRFAGAEPTLLDLECCGTGPSAYDLACYWRKRIGLAEGAPPHAEWEALLRGYEHVRPLTPHERQAISALATLRALWVMALPAAPGTTWGQDWLDDREYIDVHVAMIERLARFARRDA